MIMMSTTTLLRMVLMVVCGWNAMSLLLVPTTTITTTTKITPRTCRVTQRLRPRTPQQQQQQRPSAGIVSTSLYALSKREIEIRRKIQQLKKDGKLRKQGSDDDDDDDDDDNLYADKIRQKLGRAKSKMLGFDGEGDPSEDDDSEEISESRMEKDAVESASPNQPRRKARLGALSQSDELEGSAARSGASSERDNERDYSYSQAKTRSGLSHDEWLEADDDDDDDSIEELAEEDLVELVARRMQEKRDREQRERDARLQEMARQRLLVQQQQESEAVTTKSTSKQVTTGIGGSWEKSDETEEEDVYQPKSGSWGAFPRPRDISKAYGGGRRVGAGYTKTVCSEDETRERLQRYRVKVGIDVASEKEHAGEIDEALQIGQLAMQRGVYSTAVSALEKVTRYCSTNSKVGGQVFLELAMAYEAVGRTKEAISVYSTLSTSRIEQVKINAKRLLYGLEAMQFMQENVKNSEFSRERAKATFIDTTGLANIASKFDDVYETAYVDLSRSFYKQLTQSVVRGSREARQILLAATGPGEVERMRIVQALRSLSRHFADALQAEIERNKPKPEPTAVMNGKPILQTDDDIATMVKSTDEFVLMDAQQMRENLSGAWRLQLLADKRGDGVKFFNTSIAWQHLDSKAMSFTSLSPQGFLTVEQSGAIEFNDKRRILRRKSVEVSGGGGMLAGLLGSVKYGAAGAVRSEQQIVTVDSTMMVTRGVPSVRGPSSDDEKDYFAVWRRVDSGTFSKKV
jgi:hypothetical protein